MTKEQLDGTQISSSAIDQGKRCAVHTLTLQAAVLA
jgi:hypothetical protein